MYIYSSRISENHSRIPVQWQSNHHRMATVQQWVADCFEKKRNYKINLGTDELLLLLRRPGELCQHNFGHNMIHAA